MSDARIPNVGTVPKLGRVNEICQEWMVREDGAMAYQLQNQEIRQHYSGNKQRNAMVREDFPKAKTEQQREQELAEQAAAVYRRMLEEQEEVDRILAERLSKKLELEERMKKSAADRENLHVAKRLQDDFVKPPVLRQLKPPQESYIQAGGSMGRSGRLFEPEELESTSPDIELGPYMELPPSEQISSIYNEPYVERNEAQKTQEEADAELAKMLQEEEGNLEECIMQRDRLLAIEAQDKELAKVLQERERIKAKKAKERARQKALAKKQQKRQEELQNQDVIMPDDAYSNPADMILPSTRNTIPNLPPPNNCTPQTYDEYEDNYSLPVDRVESSRPSADSSRPSTESGLPDYPNYTAGREEAPTRPSHLAVRPVYKPRYPDPEDLGKPHLNIAMAIDPTYPKQDLAQSPGSYIQHMSPAKSVSSKSSSRSSPSSSSKEMDGRLEMTNAPPYMPIQGQKRTASLEKRRVRDGCKQQ
ncbi:coiled-coil domain-containing protein 50 [Coccinella septempunctata]|uniref:coiled-coil domain-containing protein 50 n=1 Tax=Coccinella septempunctata TaxID=41139 RepID=UPI001D08009E|nr:coiled-coil domain-containing protein 50 [Coccinella septempunctata]